MITDSKLESNPQPPEKESTITANCTNRLVSAGCTFIIIFYFRVEYIQLAAEYKPAVNLGQGFPDYHAPDHVTKALAEITVGENPLLNQYTRGFVSESVTPNI